MLKRASDYKDELKYLLHSTRFNQKYKFFGCGYGQSTPTGIQKYELVSVDKENNIIGYIEYWVNTQTRAAITFCAASFTDIPSVTFGKDIYQVIDDMFCKQDLNKIFFKIVAQNPAEDSIHSLIKKYGGYFIGYEKEPVQLFDAKYHRVRNYGLLKEQWLQHKRK